MHLANKIIIWLIFIAILPCFYYGARTLKTHAVWRSMIADLDKKLQKTEAEIRVMKHGEGDLSSPDSKPSLPLLKKRVERLQAFRGHQTWFNCEASVNRTGNAAVTVPKITEDLLPNDSKVYAFEAATEGARGKYLGYFTVTSIEGETVNLKPDPMRIGDPAVMKAIQASNGSLWNLYTLMPKDESEVFNILPPDKREDILTELLPKSALADYLKDGKVDSKTGQVFHRTLTDYEIIFDINITEEMLLNDLLIAERIEAETAMESKVLADQYLELRQKENQQLTNDKSQYQAELASITQVNKRMSDSISALQKRQAQYLNQIRLDAMKIVERENKAYSQAPRAESVQ